MTTSDLLRNALAKTISELGCIDLTDPHSSLDPTVDGCDFNKVAESLHKNLVGNNIPLMLTADEGIIFMTIGALGMAYCMNHPTDRHLFNVARAINHYGESTFESMKQKAIAYSYELEGKPQPAETL